MLIELLLDMIYGLFSLLTTPIKIPGIPSSMESYFESFFDYLEAGAGILANYIPFSYVMTLFGIILAVDVGLKLYYFVMWVLNKIPMLDID